MLFCIGIKVKVTCANPNGETTMTREEMTNMFGSYAIRFDGSPNLSNCHAQVSDSGQGSTSCAIAGGPARNLRQTFRMFDMAFYSVDSLLTQPDKPMSFCPRSSDRPVTPPVGGSGGGSGSPVRTPTPTPTSPPRSPAFRLPFPRMPPLPPLPPMPPMPFVEASACSHQ